MGFIEIVVTVCALSQPSLCEERHLEYNWNGSLTQCVMSAPPYIAQWINEHPRWQVTRWRCDYPSRKSFTCCGPRNARNATHSSKSGDRTVRVHMRRFENLG